MLRPFSGPLAAAFVVLLSSLAHAGGSAGDTLETNTLGLNLVTRDLTTHSTRTVADATNLSEYVGLHHYVVDRLRCGISLQLTERLSPAPAAGTSRLQRVALLPQVGFGFYDPFFAAIVFSYAPRTEGLEKLALGLGGILGAAFPVSDRLSVSLAVEVPWTFYRHQALGLTSLAGLSVRL
ncbi:MAG TPA: hypothetical protein VF395_03525 [Polyangiaceae bacterium]